MARLRHLTVHDESAMSTMCAGLDSRIGSIETRATAAEVGIQNLSPLLLLGAAIGEMNATNQRQNQIADASNTNGTKLAALITIVKDIAQKLNLTFDALEDNKILAAA